MTDIGLYIHTPFCAAKCNYCDFYSFAADGTTRERYVSRVTEELRRWGARIARPIGSIYLGGGTPSLLGGENISVILSAARGAFSVRDGAEITLECNPADNLYDCFRLAAAAGVNRLSVGVQSGNEDELAALGRRHRNSDVLRTVADARAAGIKNISLDLMIGLPHSSTDTVTRSVDFVMGLDPQHISVYILKLEEGTPLERACPQLPDEDAVCEQYLLVSRLLKERGFEHYEISNFARSGYESRHNVGYWDCREYLGIGPSAHSFLDGNRFYYPRDIGRFMDGTATVPDGKGGDREEYIMLRLRLKAGIIWREYEARFGPVPQRMKEVAAKLEKAGLARCDNNGVALTEEGFLLSNAVIGEFI